MELKHRIKKCKKLFKYNKRNKINIIFNTLIYYK